MKIVEIVSSNDNFQCGHNCRKFLNTFNMENVFQKMLLV